MVYGIILHKIGNTRVWLAQMISGNKPEKSGFRNYVWTRNPADAEKFSTVELADEHAKMLCLSEYYIGAVPPSIGAPSGGQSGTPITVAA